MKVGYNNLSEEEKIEVDDALNPFSFEKYCDSCDNFQTEKCPFKDKATPFTDWKQELNCEKFWD